MNLDCEFNGTSDVRGADGNMAASLKVYGFEKVEKSKVFKKFKSRSMVDGLWRGDTNQLDTFAISCFGIKEWVGAVLM